MTSEALIISAVLIIIGLLLACLPQGRLSAGGVRIYLLGGIVAFWTIIIFLLS